ncbi:uncharacterized protein SPPG_03125 [Spizellomyces punctatus DAOM BR117]|uniref:AB hydrolase-1 domain-containing protein n=1 Tax=Spizellomyces punctatus (strain DAOM BR117) TaxID=645134 RepID=A0A0L0HJU8_SPIPD|nr:uncharacterized protein SPPG_03125 [Spizellomyces punctatus DAOM BR117]KND01313.1 hypothetical protein SPPG_03125 [Spizellomyces punctatus DAOM BR117]|eukprot:XP_016609352.1 hypothetical protein SPPG_03125 [Spizellomyces punctatus DAOM BR117]
MPSIPHTTRILKAADPSVRLSLNIYRSPRPAPHPKIAVVCAHANSICKEGWEPVISRLFSSRIGENISVVYAWDARNHGDSAVLNRDIASLSKLHHFDWWTGAKDALRILEFIRSDLKDDTILVGLGHSFGGTVLSMTELMRPGTFKALVLAEPMIFTPEFFIRGYGSSDPYAPTLENDIFTRGAMRRKAVFSSREAAAKNLASKSFFQSWTEEALDTYLTYGFYQTDAGYELKCTPTMEASVFMGCGSTLSAYSRLHELTPPSLFLTGAKSEFAQGIYIAKEGDNLIKDQHLASLCRDAEHDYVPDAGHMLTLENPDGYVEKCVQFIRAKILTKDVGIQSRL